MLEIIKNHRTYGLGMTTEATSRLNNLPVGQYNLNGELVGNTSENVKEEHFDEKFDSAIIKSDNSLHKYILSQNELYMVMYCTNQRY